MKRLKNETLQEKISNLPSTAGVYKFFDAKKELLYVGKAINLRSRVSSYFSSPLDDRPWVKQMIPFIANVSVLLAENEVEALILESNLIWKHRPKYNSAGKDDKRFAWIVIDTRSPYPTIVKTRDLNLKGTYFGPYPDSGAVTHILKYLRKLYPYCERPLNPKESQPKDPKPCFHYHLGLCPGACADRISSKEYRKNISNIVKTLRGKKRSHINQLEREMVKLAKRKEFEKAAILRDKIADLRYLSQRIDIHYGDTEEEFKKIQQSRFLAGIEEIVSKLALSIPEHRFKRVRIECYDISNLSSEITYGSMVVSNGTSITPSDYRVFKIRGVTKSNDPKMLAAILTRRLRYLEQDIQNSKPSAAKSAESFLKKPDIIMLDGAQAQLSAVAPVVPDNIGLFAISKGKHLKRAGEAQEDEFWTMAREPERPDSKGTPSEKDEAGPYRKLKLENPFLFQLLRDEAHRFAIKHLRQGKRYEQKRSILDDIPGVGPTRKKILMRHFKTVGALRKASVDELFAVLHNKTAARQIHEFFDTHRK
ncbi:MAG: helix-hairpin-helix domain-containing protein [Candidatus Dojkabacteria bacterium]|nr:helix-hairpin-helix domain-containing protein [Candidatus Dojkabacteria bacterium]